MYRWIKKAKPLGINSLILAQTHLAISLFNSLSWTFRVCLAVLLKHKTIYFKQYNTLFTHFFIHTFIKNTRTTLLKLPLNRPLYCKKWDYGLDPVYVEVRRGLEPCALAEEHQISGLTYRPSAQILHKYCRCPKISVR